MKPRDQWRDTVIYQIYPRSFADSDGDGVGDLPGVIARLDHLTDLGVTAVWLSPFYPSPLADFGYDISDYRDVDPVYGTLADFDRLTAACHDRGIAVIVDLVMNHTSDRHPWFTESRASRESAYRDHYVWADPRPDGGPPNNWLSAFERTGPAWTLDPATGQYYLHSFTPGQPDLNWRSPEVQREMRDIWRFWLDRGVDGFRVDVAHRLHKDAGLRDNPAEIAHARRHIAHPELRQFNIDLPETLDVLRELRTVLDSYDDRFALGEVPISDDRRLAEYFGDGILQTVFHIAFWEQPWRGSAFRDAVDTMAGLLRPGALPTHALATHDIPRSPTRYGGGGRPRVAAMMIMTLRGVPCVYYGEEIGMADAVTEALDVDGRDGTRAPMRWDASGLGFSSGEPWLAARIGAPETTVEAQRDDPGSLLSLYRDLIRYRHGSGDLREGGYRSLPAPDDAFVYLRGERLLVALNFASAPLRLDLDGLPATGALEMTTGTGSPGERIGLRPLLLGPDEGVIVRLEEER